MVMPKGFIQTEVGVIPEDWEIKTLRTIADTDLESLSSNTCRDYIFNYISLEDVEKGRLKSYTKMVFKSCPS